ncbi:MAG: hypothetical protein WC389_14710 [Lutibacter sp.]|jgi:hypothetical protein
MKKYIHIALIAFVGLILFGCGTSKVNGQTEPPFKILEATFVNLANNELGIKETFSIIKIDNPNIRLDSLYFRNNKMSLTKDLSASENIFLGSFTSSTELHDYILHQDAKEEFGNIPPIAASKIPYELTDDEAVVSYFYKDKINYYKISEMKEIQIKD